MKKMQYFKIKTIKEESKINNIAKMLKDGAIVAMPTETVYGLFVNALDKEAVGRLFEIKERSLQKALTYHVSSIKDIKNLASIVPAYSEVLIEKLLPGPLMLLFKKQSRVPDNITGNSKKVGVRMPNNDITLEILKKVGVPVVASSANISGGISSTKPEHVMASFSGEVQQIDAIVDTDSLPLGIESTILDVSTRQPRILRMGFISIDQISDLIKIRPALSANSEKEAGFPAFAPEGKVMLVEGYTRAIIPKIKELLEQNKDKKILLVLTNETAAQFDHKNIIKMGSITSFEEIAQNLFSVLRTIEIKEADLIIIEGILPANIGAVVMDKLRKAANEIIYAR